MCLYSKPLLLLLSTHRGELLKQWDRKAHTYSYHTTCCTNIEHLKVKKFRQILLQIVELNWFILLPTFFLFPPYPLKISYVPELLSINHENITCFKWKDKLINGFYNCYVACEFDNNDLKANLRNSPILLAFGSVHSNDIWYKWYKVESESSITASTFCWSCPVLMYKMYTPQWVTSLFLLKAECIACINIVLGYTAENSKLKQKVSLEVQLKFQNLSSSI